MKTHSLKWGLDFVGGEGGEGKGDHMRSPSVFLVSLSPTLISSLFLSCFQLQHPKN